MSSRVLNGLAGQVLKRSSTVSQEGRRGLDLTEIFSQVKPGPGKDWSNMRSLQASLSSLRLVADWL